MGGRGRPPKCTLLLVMIRSASAFICQVAKPAGKGGRGGSGVLQSRPWETALSKRAQLSAGWSQSWALCQGDRGEGGDTGQVDERQPLTWGRPGSWGPVSQCHHLEPPVVATGWLVCGFFLDPGATLHWGHPGHASQYPTTKDTPQTPSDHQIQCLDWS